MCGIFGALLGPDPAIQASLIETLIRGLLMASETRGNEAAGLAVNDGRSVEVIKQAGSVKSFLKNPEFGRMQAHAREAYRRVQAQETGAVFAALGHSRMVTNGFQSDNDNNQPVIVPGAVAVHNGIIVNDEDLWKRHPDLIRRYSVDTEVMLALLRKHLAAGNDVAKSLQTTFGELFGSASTAIFLDDQPLLLLASNTGSLFTVQNERNTFLAFASERFILQGLIEKTGLEKLVGKLRVGQIQARTARIIKLADLSSTQISLPSAPTPKTPAWWELPSTSGQVKATPLLNDGHPRPGALLALHDRSKTRREVRRCTRCILPATYPFVDFDKDGACRYCRGWKQIKPKGPEALAKAVEPYRSKDGSPDVIVAFSGGRDSAYGLHYVKNVLGMNPVAFTLDWGLVTDLARRNQARICGKMGVEHILRSANLTAKRRYVRKNVEAWLRQPDAGMVTLFTAGDKEFYHHARQLRKETGIKLVIFCTGNMIEDTPYKTGLCGIREDDHGMTLTGLSYRNEMALLWYYIKRYLKNPGYWNESLWDTLKAYYYTFLVKDDFLYLFHYLDWREEEIVGTIRREYDWEVATDTKSTWRIGDGTAPFYNYIYTTICGFTEDEVMLSNMVREGHLGRDEALKRAAEYGRPRLPSIREYAQIVGFQAEEALRIINAAPKMY
jgi:glutamine---fructose-6-phosphate transaminase (isomerizing)